MKTLIINPPSEFGFDRSGRWPAKAVGGTMIEPIFLAYAAAVLEQANLPIELIDCRPFYISLEALLKRINKEVGLIVLQTSTVSIEQDLNTAKKIKENFPDLKILLVGTHVSALDKEIMEKNDFIDFIARGEYDYTIRDLAKSLNSNNANFENILGLTFRRGQEIIRNQNRPYIENLDELPFPARHFLPMETYFEPIFKSKKTYRLVGSRGCPYQCTFCLWTQTMYGRRMRSRSPKSIVDEIEILIKDLGAKGLYFEDDTFTLIPERAIAICDEMLKRKIKIPWSCMGRVDTLNEPMLKKMKQAGCYTIRFGIESASQEVLDRAHKGTKVEQFHQACDMVKKSGIEFHAAYTFGLPGETKESMEKTIQFAKNLGSEYAQFAIAMPFPGTDFFAEAQKNGWLSTLDWKEYEATENSVLNYPDLSGEEIVAAAKRAYKKYYFRPKYIFRRLIHIRSINEFIQTAKAAFNLFRRTFFGLPADRAATQNIVCPICRRQNTKTLFWAGDRLKIVKQEFELKQCEDCKMIFTYPALEWKETEDTYSSVNFWSENQKTGNFISDLLKKIEGSYLKFAFKYDTKRLLKFVGRGRIIDIGCNTGLKLAALRNEGINSILGIEPLEKQSQYAREVKNLPVETVALEEFICDDNSFDTATFYGVFEHLENPLRTLGIVKKILKPGGIIVIQAPNFDSWQAKLFKDKWAGLGLPYHYFHYTPKNLTRLLENSGFRVKKIDWLPNFIRPLFWAFSFQKSGPESDPQFIWDKEKKGESTILNRVWWIFLALISLIPNILETIFHKGGHLTIYAINNKYTPTP